MTQLQCRATAERLRSEGIGKSCGMIIGGLWYWHLRNAHKKNGRLSPELFFCGISCSNMQCDEMLCDEPFNNKSNGKELNGYDGIFVCKDASMPFGVSVNTGIYIEFMIGLVS